MQWAEVTISALISIGVGVGLWAVLPRGVVLTRTIAGPDTWDVQNASSLPIQLTAVTVQSVTTLNDSTGDFEHLPVPIQVDERAGFHGVSLSLKDANDDITRTEQDNPWNTIVLGPGDSLRAVVLNNASVSIEYRRAGWLGHLERRSVSVSGGV